MEKKSWTEIMVKRIYGVLMSKGYTPKEAGQWIFNHLPENATKEDLKELLREAKKERKMC